MSSRRKIIVATRPSKLAVTQTEQTVELLKVANPDMEFEIKTFSTVGDRDQTRSLVNFGTTGLFVKELESALLSKEADIAIHSLKDVPSDITPELALVSFPKREDTSDIIITANGGLSDLKDGAVIGTGSPRRALQIKDLNSDVTFSEIRGNIDTRLNKLHRGDYDAIVLAAAGVKRLGLQIQNSEQLPIIPAIGQGALAIECRSEDYFATKIARSINDTDTETAVTLERIFMREIEGGCKFPLAAYVTVKDGKAAVKTVVGDLKSGVSRYDSFESEISEAASKMVTLAAELKKLNIINQ